MAENEGSHISRRTFIHYVAAGAVGIAISPRLPMDKVAYGAAGADPTFVWWTLTNSTGSTVYGLHLTFDQPDVKYSPASRTFPNGTEVSSGSQTEITLEGTEIKDGKVASGIFRRDAGYFQLLSWYWIDSNYNQVGRTYTNPPDLPSEWDERTPPTPPTVLTAVPASSSKISLNWSGATDNVAVLKYYVERRTDLEDWTRIATVYEPTTTYTDMSLYPSFRYYYRVWAVDTAGNISLAPSPEASANTLGK